MTMNTTAPKSSKRSAHQRRADPEIEWREYALIEARQYPAYCRWAKAYWDPGIRRWTCLLRFNVFAEDLLTVIATVPMWLSLGEGEKPHASRRGKYALEWVRANNGPPARNDRLSPSVFRHRMALIEVGDKDPSKSPIPYSVVRKIVSWETGAASGYPVSKSHSQGRQLQGDRETKGYEE